MVARRTSSLPCSRADLVARSYALESVAVRCFAARRLDPPHGLRSCFVRGERTRILALDDEHDVNPESRSQWSGPFAERHEHDGASECGSVELRQARGRAHYIVVHRERVAGGTLGCFRVPLGGEARERRIGVGAGAITSEFESEEDLLNAHCPREEKGLWMSCDVGANLTRVRRPIRGFGFEPKAHALRETPTNDRVGMHQGSA